MTQLIRRWLPVLMWCGVIFFLSSQPHLPGPEDRNLDFFLKKMGHVTVYGVLFILVYRALGSGRKWRTLQAFLLCMLYALSDEYHQSFVPGRTPMLTDVGIDGIGMLIANLFKEKFVAS